ncbi:MAG: 16S rRNA (uracil(1498)-N(3))-methyltransferase [Campylobacteraceae bacterium]|jgi:16S rRNA (uracil1498-N3)-methyltransferase|nr:16S rRNA (uracil(1498)-N(3))-methyltransferase [Campylobacteraceae bacterium]
MQFLYHEKAGEERIVIENESFAHLFKSRRRDAKKPLRVRNLHDNFLYLYEIVSINRREAECILSQKTVSEHKARKPLWIAWSVVEPKVIEKTLPFLNEIGVQKLIFVYTKFSQRSFAIDTARLKRIAVNSCEQCGRHDMIEFEIIDSLEEFMQKYENFAVVDFSQNRLESIKNPPHIWFVGCEGGFSEEERQKLENYPIVGFESENILRSESAVMAVGAKILL